MSFHPYRPNSLKNWKLLFYTHPHPHTPSVSHTQRYTPGQNIQPDRNEQWQHKIISSPWQTLWKNFSLTTTGSEVSSHTCFCGQEVWSENTTYAVSLSRARHTVRGRQVDGEKTASGLTCSPLPSSPHPPPDISGVVQWLTWHFPVIHLFICLAIDTFKEVPHLHHNQQHCRNAGYIYCVWCQVQRTASWLWTPVCINCVWCSTGVVPVSSCRN